MEVAIPTKKKKIEIPKPQMEQPTQVAPIKQEVATVAAKQLEDVGLPPVQTKQVPSNNYEPVSTVSTSRTIYLLKPKNGGTQAKSITFLFPKGQKPQMIFH